MKTLPTLAIVISIAAIAAVWASTVEQFEPAQPTSSRFVTVTNFPNPQNVAGTVSVGNLPEVQQVQGTVEVGNLPTDAQGNVMVALQNGGGTAPLPPNFVELLDAPLPMSSGQTFDTDVLDTSGYTVVGLAISFSTPWGVTAEPQWRWSPTQSFGVVYGEDASGGCVASYAARRVCAVRGQEMRIHVTAYETGTLESLQLLLTNDLDLP